MRSCSFSLLSMKMNLSLKLVIQLLVLRFTSVKSDEESDSLNIDHLLGKDKLFIGLMGYFKRVRLTNTFVDKSGFIEEFLAWEQERTLYISAPSRFGKSTNLDMVRLFLDAPVQINNTTFQSDPDASVLFEKTYIKKKDGGKYFQEHFQKYKVISMDFRMLVLVQDFASFKVDICVTICDTMHNFYYLKHFGSKLVWCHHENRDECQTYCEATFPASLRSVEDLSRELWRIFKKRIFILGDEFDAILYPLLQNKIVPDADEIIKNYGALFSFSEKSNKYIKAFLFVGIFTLGGVISRFANFKHINFNDDTAFAKYIGFTTPEVQRLVNDAGLKDTEMKLRHWYNGHEVMGKQKLNLHNPVSISNYVSNRRFDYYWSKHVADLSNNFRDFFANPEIGSSISLIMHGQSPTVELSERLASFKTIQELKETVRSKDKNVALHKNKVDLFLQYLMESGYLTRVNAQEKHGVTLKVLNKETRHSMDNYMQEARYYETTYDVHPDLQQNYIDALYYNLSGDEKSFKNLAKSIHKIIYKKCSSVRDKNAHVLGALYHFLINADHIRVAFPEIEAELNIPTSKGKSRGLDMVLIRNDGTAIIMEAERNQNLMQLRDEHFNAINQYFKKYSIKKTIFMEMSINTECACQLRWMINSCNVKDTVYNNVVYPEKIKTGNQKSAKISKNN